MNKIKNIEILRIIGCLSVIILHFFGVKTFLDIEHFEYLNFITRNGNKAVDLFFILSGFFFMLGYKNEITLWEFTKKKLIRLYPVILFVTCCSLFLPFVKFNLNKALITLFGLNGTPLALNLGFLSQIWYVSALFWTLLFIFYLLKNYKKKNVDLFMACSIFISYGMILHSLDGCINEHSKYYYFINIGLLRAIGGISIGYFIAQWYKHNIEKFKNVTLNLCQRLLCTVVEGYCLFFVVQNLIFHQLNFQNQIIFILIFTIIIVMFLFNKGYISRMLDVEIISEISKYTYSIYVGHRIFIDLSKCLYKNYPVFINTHYIIFILFYLTSAILFGVFLYHIVEKPCAEYLKQKYLR